MVTKKNNFSIFSVLLLSMILALALKAAAADKAVFVFAFIDKTGKTLFKLRLEPFGTVGVFSEGMCSYAEYKEGKGSLFGFLDRSGKKVIPAQFAAVHAFHDGRAAVFFPTTPEKKAKGNWGFIDKTGKLIIPAKFPIVDDFSEGLAAVQAENGKFGFIDPDGKFVIAAQFKTAGGFSEGLAGVESGYIDHSGKLVIRSNRGGVHKFHCGLACREVQSLCHEFYGCSKDGEIYPNNRNWGYIDSRGRMAILPSFVNCRDFSEERAVIELPMSLPKDRAVTGQHSCYGIIDQNGSLISMLDVHNAPSKFSDGLAAISLDKTSNDGGTWGYIDKNGRMAIPAKFKRADDFSEGLAAVNGGYIDKSGELQIELESSMQGPFSEGIAAVLLPNK
ncbi:MAG: WG repeat-containing protein [Candidatus Obscuribacterales bacterium]|nr:WG repeat-containing protein [Candidatus Obscuribacterales bacterium]